MSLKNFLSNLIYAPARIKKIEYLIWALVDSKWFWFFKLMLENANVPIKYRYMFCPREKNTVLIDCWANVWLIIDIARFMDMEVYAFEPNPQAVTLLNRKYSDDKMVHIYPNAVSNKNWKIDFYLNEIELFDQWATIVKECAKIEWWKNEKISVEIVKLSSIIKRDILPKHKKIHLLKLDIEWAEFDVINDIIDEWIYKNIKYIVVETHERFFKDWKTKIKILKQKIKNNNIKNIYLDWI